MEGGKSMQEGECKYHSDKTEEKEAKMLTVPGLNKSTAFILVRKS